MKVDAASGTSIKLSNVGEAGVFGAVYFDVTGNLYISRNNDGHIFRINTNWNYPVAEFFAYGPSSSNNDGARCALAPMRRQQTSATLQTRMAPVSITTARVTTSATAHCSWVRLSKVSPMLILIMVPI